MKLALEVGELDYTRALDRITPDQFREWQAFNIVCPVGPDRLDGAIATFMAAMIRYVGGFVSSDHSTLSELEPSSFIPSLKYHEPVSNVDIETAARMEIEAARVNMEAALIASGQKSDWW